MKFNDDMRQHVPPQQLWNEFHGDMEFDYDHAVYWPALLKFAEERYIERCERWVQAGKHYGESEIYLRGGNASSVYQASESVVSAVPEEGKAPTESKAEGAEETAPEETKRPVAPVEGSSAAEDSKAPV